MARARRVAEQDHTSINQFFVVAIAEKLASLETERQIIAKRGKRADAEVALAVLGRVKDREPTHPEDRIQPPRRARRHTRD
jgi:hypothetical protein